MNREPSLRKEAERGFAPIVVILLVVVLAAAGGLVLYKKYSPGKPATGTSSPSGLQTGTPVPSSAEDELTAGWLSFSKSGVPYTFKYPKELKLTEQEGFNLSLWGPSQKADTEFYDGISLTFSLPVELQGVSLEDYVAKKILSIKELGVSEVTKPQEEITVNNISGYTFTESGLGTFQNIFLPSPDKKSVIEITNGTKDPTSQGFGKTVQTILATFKFI